MQQKISTYYCEQERLLRVFCALATKSYENGQKSLVLVKSKDGMLELDKALWSYGRIKFIPHATEYDAEPAKQPIFIANRFVNPANAELLIIYQELELLDDIPAEELKNFSRIIFISDQEASAAELKDKFKSHQLDFWKETQGQWQRLL